MFMVKEEYANIKNLLRVRLLTNAKGFVGLFVVAAIMLVGNLGTTVFGIFENTGVLQHYNVTDYSYTFFLGTAFAFIILMVLYRQTNGRLSVFPQTNNSRFISSLLMNYIIAVIAALTVLAIYFVNLGVIKLLSLFRDNIRFALTVDAGFIIEGFFVYLAYIFLIISAIELIGAILRKWTYYAAVAFTALLSLIVRNEYAPKLLAFLINEPSLTLFFIKAVGLWLVITAAALVINRFTVYHKSQAAKKGLVIICVAITAVITFVVPAVIVYSSDPNIGYLMSAVEASRVDDFFAEYEEIRIDVSHLPRGSSVHIKGDALNVLQGDTLVNTQVAVNGAENLNDLQGDTLVIMFKPPWIMVNGIDISRFGNPRITAHLDGDILLLDYNIDSANVVIMPIWGSIVRQFDCFRDEGVLPGQAFGFSSGGNSSATIFIDVE